MPAYKLHEGNNLDILPTIPDQSVDLVLTDPPYGWSFMGLDFDKALPDPQTWAECFRVLKPGGSAVVMSGSRMDCLWRMCRDLEAAGFELEQTAFFWCYRTGFPKGDDLSKRADKQAGAEREVVGKSPNSRANRSEEDGIVLQKYRDNALLTAPATDLARELDGWFTKGKVKPAVEVVIWARKPISERTELANMERWGVGGVHCGACMVPFDVGNAPSTRCATANAGKRHNDDSAEFPSGIDYAPQAGRYPANLLCTGDEPLGPEGTRYFDIECWAAEHGFTEDGWQEAAAAGLLQIPKPSRAEKNAGCEGLPTRRKPSGGSNNLKQWEEGTRSFEDLDPKSKTLAQMAQNNHNTVKPVRLFAYMIELLTKTQAVILDPFVGSGTTLVAAIQANRYPIGIELDSHYCTIAQARADHALQNKPTAVQHTLL